MPNKAKPRTPRSSRVPPTHEDFDLARALGTQRGGLSPEQSQRLFASIDNARRAIAAGLCLFPSGLDGLRALHERPDYMSRVINFLSLSSAKEKAPGEDEGKDASEDVDAPDGDMPHEDGERGDEDEEEEEEEKDAANDKTAGTNSPALENTRRMILEEIVALQPLLARLYEKQPPLSRTAMTELSERLLKLGELLRQQPPRDQYLLALAETAAQDRTAMGNSAFDGPYADLKRHKKTLEAARETIRAHYMPLLLSVAWELKSRGLDIARLASAGQLGLLRAIEGYDPSRNVAFASYAYRWIVAAMKESIPKESGTVYVPLRRSSEIRKLYRARSASIRANGHAPTDEELAHSQGLTVAHTRLLLSPTFMEPLSLDAPLTDDAEATYGDMVADTSGRFDPERPLQEEKLRALAAELMAILPDRLRGIVQARLGMDGEKGCTLEDLAGPMGLTKERVRQLQQKAYRLMREKALQKGLSPDVI